MPRRSPRILALVLLGSAAFAGPAAALTMTTFNACATAGAPLGQADKIDGTGGNAIGAGSGAPYNLVHTDDAIVCLGQHFPDATVNTAAQFINEVANTASHELGHLLGLEHADGNAGSLMNGAFDGTNKSFSDPDELSVLNAQPAYTQVVFLDFGLASSEIPGANPYVSFANAAVLGAYGIAGGAAIAAAISSIVTQIAGDYAGPWTSGATFDFYTSEVDALQAALQANGDLDFTTVLFVGAPEPTTVALLGGGLLALAAARRRARAG